MHLDRKLTRHTLINKKLKQAHFRLTFAPCSIDIHNWDARIYSTQFTSSLMHVQSRLTSQRWNHRNFRDFFKKIPYFKSILAYLTSSRISLNAISCWSCHLQTRPGTRNFKNQDNLFQDVMPFLKYVMSIFLLLTIINCTEFQVQ